MRRIVKWLAATATATVATVGLTAVPAMASLSDCQYGGWWGSESGSLSNGQLAAGFCADPDGTVRQVNIRYQKSGGSTVTLRFGWQMVNGPSAGKAYDTWWDNGAFTESAGQTKTFSWTYPTYSPAAFSDSWPCARGVMRDQSSQVLYVTKTVCH